MTSDWPKRIIDALEALDRREAPHGLYGIREAYRRNDQLPSLEDVLVSRKKTNFFKNIGLVPKHHKYRSRPKFHRDLMRDYWDRIAIPLHVDGEYHIRLHIIDYASTKVRRFGSNYRLDKTSSKKGKPLALDLESWVTRLNKRRSSLLLVAHFNSLKESSSILGRSVSKEFMMKYSIDLISSVNPDVYNRGFYTGFYLWYPVAPK